MILDLTFGVGPPTIRHRVQILPPSRYKIGWPHTIPPSANVLAQLLILIFVLLKYAKIVRIQGIYCCR